MVSVLRDVFRKKLLTYNILAGVYSLIYSLVLLLDPYSHEPLAIHPLKDINEDVTSAVFTPRSNISDTVNPWLNVGRLHFLTAAKVNFYAAAFQQHIRVQSFIKYPFCKKSSKNVGKAAVRFLMRACGRIAGMY